MKIGQALRTLRNNRQLTQAEMSGGILSPSYYSKVEQGQHRISADDLLAILKLHGISLQDFQYLIDEQSLDNQVFIDFQERNNHYRYLKDLEALNNLLQDVQASTDLSPHQEKILTLFIYQFIYQDQLDEIPESVTQDVFDYFMQLEE